MFNNNGNQNTLYKIESFIKNDTSGLFITSYIYNINLFNGTTQRFMHIDSFALPGFYYKDMNGYYGGVYYAVNFFKVLKDNKLFLSVSTNYKCTPDNFNSYLLILGNTVSSINQNKNKEGKFYIYPNPNNGIFTIAFENKNNSTLQIQLIDVAGNIIYQENKTYQNKTEFTIMQTNLAKGIYCIKLSDGKDIYINRCVVQ